jgi:hypothetical protein
MKKSILTGYTFNASAGTLNLSSIPNFSVAGLLAVIDITANVILYAPALSAAGITNVAGSTVTFGTNTSALSNSDSLMIIYDDGSAVGNLPASGLTPVTGAFGAATAATITIATPAVVTLASHGFQAGTRVVFETSGSLPTGITAGTTYYVSSAGLTSGTFQIAATEAYALAGTNSIATTGTQSGTQTVQATQSSNFAPIAGRPFNISLWGTFAGSVQLERSFDGATWLPVTAAGVQLCIWTAPASESWEEDEVKPVYRLNCTLYTSGTANYRISQ